jgi:hypothetical protein
MLKSRYGIEDLTNLVCDPWSIHVASEDFAPLKWRETEDNPDEATKHIAPRLVQVAFTNFTSCTSTLNPELFSPKPYSLSPIPHAVNPIPSTLYPIPYTLYPIPYTLYPIPYTLYPIPYTLNPIPYTLYPIPYTLCPIPCILNPLP